MESLSDFRKHGSHGSVTSNLSADGYPTRKMLLAHKPPVLTENKIDGFYSSVAEYLDIQHDLLLEDFMFPVRESLREFKRKNCPDILNDGRVYKKVKLTSVQRRTGGDLTCFLDIENNVHKVAPSFGYLLVFARQGFDEKDIFLGTVISSPEKSGVDAIQVRLKQFKDAKLTKIELQKEHFIVIESDAFFYMYRHVLRALTTLNEHNFPMKKYIVYGSKETKVAPPEYLSDLTKYKIFDRENVAVLDTEKWPSFQSFDVDETQYLALKSALTEEIALVQGPPGTGKTYFGVRLVKILLDNINVWNETGSAPLLVICQSNQALDHFLEGVLCYSNKVVRIGDQCQSEDLKPFCLKDLVIRKLINSQDGYHIRELKTYLEDLDEARLLLHQLSKGIVHIKTLHKQGVVSKEIYDLFTSEEHYLEWLGIGIKVDRKDVDALDTNKIIISINDLEKHIDQQELAGDYFMANKVKAELLKVQDLLKEYAANTRKDISWDVENILSLNPNDSQQVYLNWTSKLHSSLILELKELERRGHMLWDRISFKTRQPAILSAIQSAHVVGLTSTGAASRCDLLQEVEAPIVIVEEAAEVLESHVVVSMTERCQHLIMIGDHQQLQPGVSTHHMATQFNLNVSLFERLLRNEVVKGTCLTKQYRMRPEVSFLLKPHIYKVLDDAGNTLGRPPVRGVSRSVFFLNHRYPEQKEKNVNGCYNLYEVDMLMKLAEYLVSVGYLPKDITIIAMYREQINKLIEAREKVPKLQSVMIASVDSFQGKENEIILLSLVRSNNQGEIGFLKKPNRICVALSRAKSGLFIVGNMDCLSRRSKMWREVHDRLRKQQGIDYVLTLVCEEHKKKHCVARAEQWAPNFCTRCLKNMNRKKNCPEPMSRKPTATPEKSKRGEVPCITPCICCQSFYCDLELPALLPSSADEKPDKGENCDEKSAKENCGVDLSTLLSALDLAP